MSGSKKHIVKRLAQRALPGSLRGKIILLIFLLVSVSISLVGVLFYTRAVGLTRRQAEIYARNLCVNLSRDLDAYIGEMDRICRIFLGNAEIQSLLERRRNPGYSNYKYFMDQELITSMVLSLTSVQDSFIILLFDENGNGIYTDSNHFSSYDQPLFENSWLSLRKGAIDNRELFIVPALFSGLSLYSGHPAFYVIRPLRRVRNNQILGYLMVAADSLNLETILRRYAPALRGVEARVVSPENVVLLSLDKEEQGASSPLRDRETVSYMSAFSRWRTEIRIVETYGRNEMAATGIFAVLIIGITMAASLLLASLIAGRLLRPLRQLAQGMAGVGKGNFNIGMDDAAVDRDLKQIVSGFNTMVQEIRKLLHTVQEEKLLLKSAQLEALRYQINPHFLYNTFETIDAIGEVQGTKEICVIAQALGKLFRYSTAGSSEVFLQEEINQMDMYLSVEKIRFGERISWEFRISKKAAECRVMKFILQPLIENAVVHGLKSFMKKGFIRISGEIIDSRLKEPVLEITVWDNGAGIDDEKLIKITRSLEAVAHAEFSSDGMGTSFIGILNVHRRIVNFYGPDYGLSYRKSQRDGGTTARIILPAFSLKPLSGPVIN
ncbi:MAG: histidine kinase [Treponema sp.]|nr:histidine kinase [Treponema sp.]